MDEDDARGPRLSKRFSDKDGGGEVDYKTKAGTAWSHSFLNQKPWHPLSYPNQRRKWIAEQTHAQRDRRAIEVVREKLIPKATYLTHKPSIGGSNAVPLEYAQEQEFFRQTALVSKKEKEKMEMMKAVSFMYVRPPGYNAESAKAAEIAEDMKKQEPNNSSQGPSSNVDFAAMPPNSMPSGEEKKKPRPTDIYGRALPTEEQFEVLKNAPRLETGVAARAKPFGVEIWNVKCLRCGNFGHQSGDRECPLKDTRMPNEESRLKRDDPLTTILDHTDPTEPLKWELKQKPGMSPPCGGFKPDPNQQIVAEDIFDQYGGFLSGQNIPELLTSFLSKKPKKKKSTSKGRHKRRSSPHIAELTDHEENNSSSDDDRGRRSKTKKDKKKKRIYLESSSPNKKKKRKYSEPSSPEKKQERKYSELSSADKKKKREYSESSLPDKKRKRKYSESNSPDNSEVDRQHRSSSRRRYSSSSDSSDSHRKHRSKNRYHHSYSHHWHRPDSLSK